MRVTRLSLIVVTGLFGCGGRGHKEPAIAAAPEPIAAKSERYRCGPLHVSVPPGAGKSYDDEGHVILRWKGRRAFLQLPSDKAESETSPPVEPKEKSDRHVLEMIVEQKLRAQGCEFRKEERSDATWYSCELPGNGGRARVLTGLGDDGVCLAMCASKDDDPEATSTCEAVAPTL